MNEFLFRVCGAVAVLVLGACSTAWAAPVTFGFEAEIDRLSGIPFDSGINFSVGDIISGQFTFDPSAGDGTTHFVGIQPHSFGLNINGVAVSVPTFSIEVFNDTPILDFPPTSQVDSIKLGAGDLAPLQPELFPNIDATVSNFRMEFLAPTFSLDQASIPGSAAVWNEFVLRRQLSVRFRSGSGDVVGFHATVRPFFAIPEPTPGQLVFTAFVLFFAANRLVRDKGYGNENLEVLEK